MSRPTPQRIEAPEPSSNPASIIFLHGFGDDADGWTNIAHQFHSASKLPHLSWVFPTAPHNHDAMANAWYTPTSFSPIPVGRSSAASPRNDEDDEEEEQQDYDGMLASVEYLCTLIDAEIERGVKPERIVIGGFSQGCAISLLAGLAGRWKGRIGGVVGLSGYLPKGKRIWQAVEGKKEDSRMQVFLAHGTKDMLVPTRVFRDAKKRIEDFVGEDVLEVKVYEGLGHVTRGDEFRDMCSFLERILPA